MKRLLSAIYLFTLLGLTCFAAGNVSFSVVVRNQTVRVGEKFQVTYVLKNASSNSDLPTPNIPGCRLTFGPGISRAQSYSNINGRAESSSSVDYTYTYVAEKEGKATVPALTITADGKKITSKPATINIIAASAPTQQPVTPGSRPVTIDDPTTQTSDRSIKGNDVFIRIITSRNHCYEQEAVECTIKLYTKYNIREFMPITQPAFNGFTVEDLPIQASLNEIEIVNGQEYYTGVVKKCVMFPQKSGNLTINSGTYDLTVVQYDQVNVGFYQALQPQTKKIRVNSNSVSVNVDALPSPQPSDFNGAVGQFSVKSSLSSTSFRTNEPVTLTYTVSGTGNIRYIKDVVIDFPPEFEQYSPQHNVDAQVSGNNVVGTSVTELTFVPKETGRFTINVPDFVYFDPIKKEYVTIRGERFEMNVSKGLSSGPSDRKDVESKNVDILYIRSSSDSLTKEPTFYISSAWYWIVVMVLIAGGVTFIILSRRNARLSADTTGRKKSKANSVARRRLKLAGQFLTKNDPDKFYEEILRAMWGYFSDKLSIPTAELTRSSIGQQLSEKGIDQKLTNYVTSLLDQCEMARYTPTGGSDKTRSVYDQACEIINKLEKQKLS